MARGIVIGRYKIADTGLYVTLSANGSLYQRLRTMKSRKLAWSRVEQLLGKYYASMAADLQRLVVEEYEKTRERPNVSTGRLDAATLDERNRVMDKGGFYIGNPAFLDKSEAKYWRQIEEGYTGHATHHREFYGMFGATITGRFHTYPSGKQPAAGPDFTFIGQGAGGKFQPKSRMRVSDQRKHFSGPRSSKNTTRLIIKKPIKAQDAYSRAFVRFRRSNRAFWLFRQVVMAELGLSSAEVGRSYQSIIDKHF